MPYNALDLVYNPLKVTIPFPAGYATPEKLRYLAELYIPEAADSTTFMKLTDLEAKHRPPKNGVYSDAECEVHQYLQYQFPENLPAVSSDPFTRLIRLPGATLPYYLRYKRDPYDQNYTQLATRYALNAGLSYEQYPGNVFFTDILPIAKLFLTWQPKTKTIQRTQPEFLDFLVNFSGVTSLRLMVKTYLSDGTSVTSQRAILGGVIENSVYRCAVGPVQLGLAANVVSYEVWLEDQNDLILSEIRTFRLDHKYRRNVTYLFFRNSLGAYDTLCLTGRSQQTLSIKSETVQRFLNPEYVSTDGEFEVNQVSGESSLEVSTGYMNQEYYDYLQDFFLSKRIFLYTERALLPYSLQTKDLPHAIDDETLFGLKLKLKAGFTQSSYSRLPDITFTATLTYTATCPQGQVGNSVTRSATATSTISLADAEQKATSQARALAEAELVCSFAADGTFVRTECKPNTTELWTIVANGSGGERYGQLVSAQATQCGYVPGINFTVTTTTIPGQIVIDNVVGGDASQVYEYSWNQIDWFPLTGAGGYNNPKTITLPVGGLISVSVRRGAASKSVDVLVPKGTSTSRSLTLFAIKSLFDPTTPIDQIRLFLIESSAAPLPAITWARYTVSRRVDANPANNVVIRRGWLYYNAATGYDLSTSYVTIDVVTVGTVYDLILEASPVGYLSQSSVVTL